MKIDRRNIQITKEFLVINKYWKLQMKTQKRSQPFSLLMKLDLFGEEVGFSIDGAKAYPSCFGCLISLIVILFTSCYAYRQYENMLYFQDTFHSSIE